MSKEVCEECELGRREWKCPRCDYEICDTCHDILGGDCIECAPQFEKIHNKDWMKAARKQTKKKLAPMKKAIMEVASERNKK